VLVNYGSGNPTHDNDFMEAAPSLVRMLATHPGMRLRIMGQLSLPLAFAPCSERIERYPLMPFANYFALLAESNITIAPLRPLKFNDAKSNIKFLEAAILGLPIICSPRAHYALVVRLGENGMLAERDEAWFAALLALASDGSLRRRIGRRALISVGSRYSLGTVARTQVLPLLQTLATNSTSHNV